MNYEYSFLHRVYSLDAALQDASLREVASGTSTLLGEFLQALEEELPSHKGGGWEVISHDMSRLGAFLLITVMLRRAVAS